MTVARTTAQVTKKLGHKHVTLYKDVGYLYFAYDDVPNKIWETKSIMVCYLNQLSLEEWIKEGQDFIKDVEGRT